jgi:hypothetical protein
MTTELGLKNTKTRTEAMQRQAMETVEIEPLSEEATTLINQTMRKLNLTTRSLAFQVLRDSGELDDVEIGGETLNQAEAITGLMREFGCTKETARRHVAGAARRKRHPDWRPPKHGGQRPGAGRPKRDG